MPRILLVSNDFPPRPGGIQAYLHQLALALPAGAIAVYAPDWPEAAAFDAGLPFPVIRHRGPLMIPTPEVLRRAAGLLRELHCDTAWFGAAAPLALLGPALRRAGVRRVVASSHGHEVGWSMLPPGRMALRRIGADADVVTAVSRYTRRRVASAFGPRAALEILSPGVDCAAFRPDPAARAEIRRRHRLGDAPVVLCVSRLVARKGQDMLVRALPAIRRQVPGAMLLLVGDGPRRPRLHRLAESGGVADAVVYTGAVSWAELPAYYAAGDVFAMPCRTRGHGLDVEGFGLVFLEASAAGLPLVVGDAGGAGETVRVGDTGELVNGRDVAAVTRAVATLLADPEAAVAMGRRGRRWMLQNWDWSCRRQQLGELLLDTR
ncbi:MAG: alpha-(1-2)-phosphatidylinositol mannosyltransferase [Pseudonocardiales bacterium]|nr:MAG: alpha-(1-2)-phosphatidylinositol mannosyltransferase [Pseudonocardiales bacterium]